MEKESKKSSHWLSYIPIDNLVMFSLTLYYKMHSQV